METMVLVEQHRNHHYRKGYNGFGRFGSFGSPSREFVEINCRTFQSAEGLLPTPVKTRTKSSGFGGVSPRTPSPGVVSKVGLQGSKSVKLLRRSSVVPISINKEVGGLFSDEFLYSELWAGPAYSNSPPPSSLPIPKFSVRPKRTVSLELPKASVSDVDLPALAKSAPPSPTREHKFSQRDKLYNDDSATKTLRRILNLDFAD